MESVFEGLKGLFLYPKWVLSCCLMSRLADLYPFLIVCSFASSCPEHLGSLATVWLDERVKTRTRWAYVEDEPPADLGHGASGTVPRYRYSPQVTPVM